MYLDPPLQQSEFGGKRVSELCDKVDMAEFVESLRERLCISRTFGR